MPKSKGNTDGNPIEQILFDGLDDHGFLFQEKCAQVLRDNENNIKWRIQSEEYPITIGDWNTRVDIILSDTSGHTQGHEIYVIIECKRVNPERGYWLFGKPFLTNYTDPLLMNLQGNYERGSNRPRFNQLKPTFERIGTYLIDNWWIAINKKGRKDEYESSPSHIEATLAQVCIGVSGIAQELWRQFLRVGSDVNSGHQTFHAASSPA